MHERIVRIAVSSSTPMLVVVAVLFVCSYIFSPWDHFVSISDSFHVGVWGRSGLDSRIVIFNNAEYGPYRGSLIGIADSDGNVHYSPPLLRRVDFDDSWGIYYRDFEWSEARLWTLMVSLWYPIVLFSIAPSVRCVIRASNSWQRPKR